MEYLLGSRLFLSRCASKDRGHDDGLRVIEDVILD